MMARDETRQCIDEEWVCADSLKHCLEQSGSHHVSVLKEADDPPDFWMTIDGETFAAEVTSLSPGEAYSASCKRLTRQISRSLREQGNLTGTYVLCFRRRPGRPRRTSPRWRALVANATSFLHATRDASATDEVRLLDHDDGHVAICKVSRQGAALACSVTEDAKWEGRY